MQSAINSYAKNIIYFMIFITMAGMILPGKNFKKYINLCLGLILILVILSPLANIMGAGVPITKLLAGITVETDSSSLSDYEKERRDMIKSSFENQLKEQIRALVGKEGYELYDVSCELGDDLNDIKSLDLLLGFTKKETRGLIRIEPVKTSRTVTDDNDEHKKIKSLISDFYNLSVDNIYIKIK